jgi:hypothetical protein
VSNLAQKLRREEALQEVGTVLHVQGADVWVLAGGQRTAARRAPSCLLQPEAGDLVLLATVEGRASYVLAILEREQAAGGKLVHEGDLALQLSTGRLSIAAQRGVSVVSGGDLSCVAGTVKARAVEAELSIERTTLVGLALRAEVECVKFLGRLVDSILERLTQKVQRSFRSVSELDVVRAEQMDYVAKKNVSLRGRNALVTAEELVKLDGEQVHLG